MLYREALDEKEMRFSTLTKLGLLGSLLLVCFFAESQFRTRPKIYDCFLFFNEIELLKIRFAELDDVVDFFVLVESAETQRGTEKPFIFAQNKDLFAPYLSKVIYVSVDERHPELGLWERENYQRNCIARGLTQCKEKDIVLISDLDEIPRRTAIADIVQFLTHHSRKAVALQQEIYFYQLNRQTPSGETWGGGAWHGTVGTTYKELAANTPQYFRNKRMHWHAIKNGGWHFTWMGGREKVALKRRSVVEGIDSPQPLSDAEFEEWLNDHPAVPLDHTFPAYVLKNQEYLKSIGYIAEAT